MDTLSQAEANFLVENDYNIYRIVHRIFAPEMRFFDQFDCEFPAYFKRTSLLKLIWTLFYLFPAKKTFEFCNFWAGKRPRGIVYRNPALLR